MSLDHIQPSNKIKNNQRLFELDMLLHRYYPDFAFFLVLPLNYCFMSLMVLMQKFVDSDFVEELDHHLSHLLRWSHHDHHHH